MLKWWLFLQISVFSFLFWHIILGMLSVHGTMPFVLFPVPHIGRGRESCQHRDWLELFNEYGGIWWCVESFVRKKSLNTCILSYVMETFIMIDSFWTAYYADVLFMSYFCKNSVGSYFILLSWICHDFIFLLNVSVYRQYFSDIDACCKPRTQLFIKFNDCWRQLNSHELVAKISWYQKQALTMQKHVIFDIHGKTVILPCP